MRKILFFLILFCPALMVYSQHTVTVTGTVNDAEGEPLPGVTVVVKGKGAGTVTDIDGNYRISNLISSDVLVFSFIGLETQEIAVGSRQVIDVTLLTQVKELEEVIVVGYGVQKKESSVAAISQVKGDDLIKVASTNISAALTGQLPGVSTVQMSGKPGSDGAKIYIRGISSWMGNDPLVMVDGVERDFNEIEPTEIETISVLKDASATAVFGVRGANGVILITTKRGKKGQVKVNVILEQTLKTPINMLAPMDSYNTGLVMNQAARNDDSFNKILSDEILEHYKLQDMPYIYPNTNWQDVMFKDLAFSQKYSVNISGGTDLARIFSSLTYTGDNDVLKTEKQPFYDPRHRYDKMNYRFNADVDITKTTLLSIDAGGYIGIRNQPFETSAQRLFRPIFVMGPMDIPPYYPKSVIDMYPDSKRPEETGVRIASTTIPNFENPMIASNYSGSRTQKTNNLNVSFKINQNLDIITQGLSFKGSVAFNNTIGYQSTIEYNAVTYRLRPNLSWDRIVGRDGKADNEGPVELPVASTESLTGSPFKNWYYEASLNYSRTFDKHVVTGLLVGQRRKAQSDVDFPMYQQGIASRVTYDYDNKYLLEANLGINGSEQFAPQNRYGIFPSFGLGWNLHHERFFSPLLPIISRAKIRSSWGLVGSDASSSRWLYTSAYTVGGTGVKYNPGTESSPGTAYNLILEESAANLNATWEKAIKRDIGAELAFLENQMFTLNFDFFDEYRYDILLDRLSVPDWFGVGMKQQNLGSTKTKGYEVDLKFQYAINRNLNYWIKGGVNFSDNRIISRDEPMYKPEYQKQAGKRIFQMFGLVSQDLIQDPDMMMNSIRYGSMMFNLGDIRWVDFNGDGVIDMNDEVPIGYTQQYPLYTFNFSSGLRYKNFEFDFMFVGATGVSRKVDDAFRWPLHRLTNQAFEYQLDVWSPTNRDARYPSFRYDGNRLNNTIADGHINSNSIYDATYIRLKTVNLNYNVPAKITKQLGMSNLNVYLRGNNLWTWSPFFPLADPEISDGGNALAMANYPLVRRFQIGLTFTF